VVVVIVIHYNNSDYVNIIPQLKVAKFRRLDKQSFKPGDYWEYGLIAQDIQKIAPQLVMPTFYDDPDSMLSLNITSLFSMNIQMVQQLIKELEDVKARLHKLEPK